MNREESEFHGQERVWAGRQSTLASGSTSVCVNVNRPVRVVMQAAPVSCTGDFRPATLIAGRWNHHPVMAWITRRIAGSITFVIVSAILGAWAVASGHLTGEPTLSTAWGAGILAFAFLVSRAGTHRTKVSERTRKAWGAC